MRHFWALPAFLRLAIASQHQFNVLEDLYTHPLVRRDGSSTMRRKAKDTQQFDIHWHDDTPVPHEIADSRVANYASKSISATVDAHTTEASLAHPPAPDDAGTHLDSDITSYESLVVEGQRYLCSIPRVLEEPKNKSNKTLEEEESELALATERGWELIKGMEGQCIYYVSGWWSYSFCYNDGVRQFHQLPPGKNVPVYPPVEDQSVQAYTLGKFDKKPIKQEQIDASKDKQSDETETGLAKLETKGELRYLVHHLKGGTTCDLTGKERKIEVQVLLLL
jgi:protein OS-9